MRSFICARYLGSYKSSGNRAIAFHTDSFHTFTVNGALQDSLFFVTVLLLAGCVSPPTASEAARLEVFMSRWDDVRSRKPVGRMAFAKNDRPAAVLLNLGWQEQRVSVEFIRQDTGKVVFESGASLPRNEWKYVLPPEPLVAGSYNLKVTPQNAPPVVQNFTVYGY